MLLHCHRSIFSFDKYNKQGARGLETNKSHCSNEQWLLLFRENVTLFMPELYDETLKNLIMLEQIKMQQQVVEQHSLHLLELYL